jgi:hypothetical protein
MTDWEAERARLRIRREATSGWPRTARGKITCPMCGARGWPDGRWIDKHLTGHDFRCHVCGRYFATAQGIANHYGRNPSHK